jgi:hypothetical protein
LATGEAAAAGEGLTAGLGLFAGAVWVAGELAVAGVGLAALGAFESLAGSQAAANAIEHAATSSSAMRLTKSMALMFGVFIYFSLIPTRLKSGMIIARSLTCSNGRSHRRFAGISLTYGLKPSLSMKCLHD